MNIEELKNSLPDSAKDIKLNLSTILTEAGAADLSLKQIYSIALASAYACKSQKVTDALLVDVSGLLSNNEIEAAKAAAIIMAMNNVYYRFTHIVSDKSYASMPANLRMNIIGNPGVSKIDFELNCLAVSSINGCGMCMDAHANALTRTGLSKQAVQSAVRIASIFNAFCLSIDIALQT
jgi:alkyl hydroperoxide reductase subunit D